MAMGLALYRGRRPAIALDPAPMYLFFQSLSHPIGLRHAVMRLALLEISNPALNLRSVAILVIILIGSLTVGFRAEAMDFTGAWATDAAACKKIFSGPVGNPSFTEDADVYGSGFIYEKNRLRGKVAICTIVAKKEEGDVLHLVTTCSTDVALETVQFSLRIDNANQITRLFPGLPELQTAYFRCSL